MRRPGGARHSSRRRDPLDRRQSRPVAIEIEPLEQRAIPRLLAQRAPARIVLEPDHPIDLFDLTLTGLTNGCVIGVGSPIQGIATYDQATGRFLAFAPFGLRADGYHLFGAR